MKILALDTSSNACSVALLEGSPQDFSCIERFEMAPRQHTQLILPMIDSVLNEAGYEINEIDVLAYGRGPGAFTGVRVATGVVQAISYGAALPVAQVSSLAALAQGRAQTRTKTGESDAPINKILVASDARMGEIYFAVYEMNNGFMTLTGKEQVLKPEQLGAFLNNLIILNESWHTTGNGWSVYTEQLNAIACQCALSFDSDEIRNQLFYPDAKDIAYLAFQEIAENTLVNAEQVSPVYLRNNVAKKSQK
ncbi:MAG: tRNA (adenosine(37)-N6)-threonylcarbamoyltransferase complex dimerization subunit type 1 TsaB [gamma proteobacterium symbiont of Bathyaustriella thionipta]|nr:tRNA (adenosine(37)-N6)-threonylcarbamoyltransferase complex dimerization subunit type 1 TsaB [gamma proteobacterium symbiont of Bathyaustriella thionipta]MCU7949755.1 tRNA (adenosine(37)-N6)-threonylcarbamoyltransferase complex dimerization subunit type 1 TsaB [gamma proteobacterium symbiont of Bathyaustriella thionipta]MCU7952476.1 tRNA (adenosine(37)-N6)-threonylcarbamoyltransferase complex dimerization subunit type 1 TsaB [gamma proteobacterium symbiont of Bathyaustriella thionipta]MCU795